MLSHYVFWAQSFSPEPKDFLTGHIFFFFFPKPKLTNFRFWTAVAQPYTLALVRQKKPFGFFFFFPRICYRAPRPNNFQPQQQVFLARFYG